jgi:hypothetical protein
MEACAACRMPAFAARCNCAVRDRELNVQVVQHDRGFAAIATIVDRVPVPPLGVAHRLSPCIDASWRAFACKRLHVTATVALRCRSPHSLAAGGGLCVEAGRPWRRWSSARAVLLAHLARHRFLGTDAEYNLS